MWRWENDVHEDWLDRIKSGYKPLNRVIKATRYTHGEDTAAYLTYMAIRLIEMHRVLKPTGSIYLHCDHSANSYLRMTMDAVFGRENFQREVIWQVKSVSGFKSRANNWVRDHETILYYSKSGDYKFNKQRLPYRPEYIDKMFKGVDSDGRRYRQRENRRYYADEGGVPFGSVWTDIHSFQTVASSTEITGYPTQKPVALAERIIKASTNPGDIVLDCFAGCAYVPVAAERNGRDWIACDISPRATTVLRRQFAKFRYAVDGEAQGDEPALIADANVIIRSPKDLPVRTDESPEPVRTKSLPVPEFKVPSSIIPNKEMLEFLLELSGYMAWCCGFANRMPDGSIVRTTNNFHLDHVDPKSKGGLNQITNRAPMCQRHNIRKKDRYVHLREYRQEIADDGEMMVNTTEDLINLAWAADRALARHVQEAVKHGVQGELQGEVR